MRNLPRISRFKPAALLCGFVLLLGLSACGSVTPPGGTGPQVTILSNTVSGNTVTILCEINEAVTKASYSLNGGEAIDLQFAGMRYSFPVEGLKAGENTVVLTVDDDDPATEPASETLTVTASKAGSGSVVSVSSLTGAAELSAAENALVAATVEALLGVSVSEGDFNAVLDAQVNVAAFFEALGIEAGADTSLEVEASLAEIIDALIASLEGEAASAEATLTELRAEVADLSDTIALGDLFSFEVLDEAVAQANVNVLDVLIGSAQLYNFENGTTDVSVDLGLGALGLGDVLEEASLRLRVTEAPVIAVGPEGATFESAAVRFKLGLDLVDVTTDNVPDLGGVLGPLLNNPLARLSANLTVGQLDVYGNVAQTTGSVTLIDALENAVSVQVTPGVSQLALGTFDDAAFFENADPIDFAEVGFGQIGELSISARTALVNLGSASFRVSARASAQAEATPQELDFAGPLPETQELENLDSLLSALFDLELKLEVVASRGVLGGVLNLVDQLAGVVEPVIEDVLEVVALEDTLRTLLAELPGVNVDVNVTVQTIVAGADQEGKNMVALGKNNTLTLFNSAATEETEERRVQGVRGSLLGIDYRPANGLLYGVSSSNRLYTIDLSSGSATEVSRLNLRFNGGSLSGFDFNPAADRLRFTGSNEQNFRVNVDTGEVTLDGTLAFASGDVNEGTDPTISASAYRNSFANAPTTALYDIDTELDVLTLQDPPNDGTLATIGELGVDFAPEVGFDIVTDGTTDGSPNMAYALSDNQLYTINIATGKATPMGDVAGGSYLGLAVIPAN